MTVVVIELKARH